jgi:ribose 5-phosphate isomerase B
VYVGEVLQGSEKEETILALTRTHNDANVLSLGAHFIAKEEAARAVLEWLTTPFSDEERHLRRIQKIENLTKRFNSTE